MGLWSLSLPEASSTQMQMCYLLSNSSLAPKQIGRISLCQVQSALFPFPPAGVGVYSLYVCLTRYCYSSVLGRIKEDAHRDFSVEEKSLSLFQWKKILVKLHETFTYTNKFSFFCFSSIIIFKSFPECSISASNLVPKSPFSKKKKKLKNNFKKSKGFLSYCGLVCSLGETSYVLMNAHIWS